MFIDTAAFIALADEGDGCHARAKRFASELTARVQLFTSDLVLAETYSNLRYHLGGDPAREFSRSILAGDSGVELLLATHDDLLAAQRILEKYRDQKFSLVDAASFILMERHRIQTVFTFDRHFAVYRPSGRPFRVIPG